MRIRAQALLASAAVALGAALGAAAPALAKSPSFKRLFTVNGSTAQVVGMARRPSGSLHLVFQTFAGRAFSGLAALSISPSGSPGPQIQALAGWQAGQPGLVAFPNGQLEAVFGAISPGGVSSVWGITSANGGATWAAPVDVRAGGPNEALAYGSDITAVLSGTTPVLALPQAGNLVIQRGLGANSPNYQLTNVSDGSAGSAGLAADAPTGEVVAGWPSGAGTLRDYVQGASPTVGAVQAVPGQYRNSLQVAGRDKGAGVFAAYTPDNRHVRLLRYGGGSLAVGSLPRVTPKVLGVATGIGGRIWVMWGDENGGLAVTRSNKAVTRFEPIQQLKPNSFSLYRVQGDGRLGPLDVLVDQIPNAKGAVPPPGEYYARVLPVLSVTVTHSPIKNKKGKVIGHKLVVTVRDAGDAVSGATVAIGAKKQKTNSKGQATIIVPGPSGVAKLTVTDAGYQVLTQHIKY